MILDVEKARLNNGILMSKDRNCNKMKACNISGDGSYQCNISTKIEECGLLYQKVNKYKIVNKYGLSGMS